MSTQLLLLKQKELTLLQQKKTLLIQAPAHNYTPSPKQRHFHAAGKHAGERLFLAGNRCGKTYCGAMEMAMHLTGLYPHWWQGQRFEKPIRAWAASITAETTRDILQAAYIGNDETPGTLHPSLILRKTMKRGVSDAIDTLNIHHASGGVSVLGFKSYDQGREKFQGTSRHFIHLDEEPDLMIYEECLLRTLDVGGSLMMTMTPLKGMTDVCEHFLSTANSPHKHVTQATWDDAPHLSMEEKTRLRATLRPHELEAREKGIPALGRGKVFPIKEADISIEPFTLPPHFKHVYGLDFGWTNPTAIVWAAYDAAEDIVYLHDCYTRAEAPPSTHAAAIQAKGAWMPGVCDPAGQSTSQQDGTSLVEAYGNHGIWLNKADNSVEAGLMHMLERMQTGRLKVFENLNAWWHEFRLYRRDEKGRIVKRHDHLMDATRYLITSGLPLARPQAHKATNNLKRTEGWTTV